MTEQEVRAHNERELWRDVSNHLTVAFESVERAQVGLEDLDRESTAAMLEPVVDLLRQAATNAAEVVGS